MGTDTITLPKDYVLDNIPELPNGFILDEQIDPIKELKRSDEAWRVSKEYDIPIDETSRLVAGPEPSAFGKYLEQIREYIRERTGYFEPPLYGKQYREEHPIKTIGQIGARTAAIYAGALSVTATDVLTNKITGDKRLADLVDIIN